MTNKKHSHATGGKQKPMSPQTAEMLSQKQTEYQKSEQHNFPIPDKREEARREHTNGSTPRKDS